MLLFALHMYKRTDNKTYKLMFFQINICSNTWYLIFDTSIHDWRISDYAQSRGRAP